MAQILLGTYTKKESEGIYKITLNEQEEKLENLSLIAQVNNPTYLDYDGMTQTIYSVAQDGDKAGIAVFDYDGEKASLLYQRMEEGVPPCYVRYHAREGLIYDANYHLGKVTITQNEKIDKVIQYPEGAKAHFSDFDPKTGAMFTCDLGLDTVHKYNLLNEIATYHFPKGTGPRHIAFHPKKPILYVFGELSSDVTVLRDDGFDLTHIQTISTLKSQDIKKWGAAIRISEDGKFVYVSNRGDNTITVFEVLEDATLKAIQIIDSFGDHPRDFALSLDDKYLVVAHMISNSLSLFRRNELTGLLELIEKDVYAPEAVCVKFI